MSKDKKFTGQPILSQILKTIPTGIITTATRKYNCNRYYKSIPMRAHLVSLLYGVFSYCNGLRELCEGMLACEGKLTHLGLNKAPARSTLSDANSKRSYLVFEHIYFELVRKYHGFISDSRLKGLSIRNLKIIDSTGHGVQQRLKLRLVYKDNDGKLYVFITNNFKLPAKQITLIYRNRWMTELLFKQIKQNFPLRYFWGESENAIKIQVYAVLIAQLLMVVIRKKAATKKSFANMITVIRLHLMSYVALLEFIKDSYKTWKKYHPPPLLICD